MAEKCGHLVHRSREIIRIVGDVFEKHVWYKEIGNVQRIGEERLVKKVYRAKLEGNKVLLSTESQIRFPIAIK